MIYTLHDKRTGRAAEHAAPGELRDRKPIEFSDKDAAARYCGAQNVLNGTLQWEVREQPSFIVLIGPFEQPLRFKSREEVVEFLAARHTGAVNGHECGGMMVPGGAEG